MLKVFEIYLYICGIIISIIILAGLIAIALNVIAYLYESSVGFDTFKKFLKKYNKDMQELKRRKCDKCINYKTMDCPNSSKCYDTLDKPYFKIKEE